MIAVPKIQRVDDPAWIRRLHGERCILTGFAGTEADGVDPLHVGTLGTGIKIGDDMALPILHSLHRWGHDHGEMTMFRKHAPDWLLREAFRAYAREFYREHNG